ncbi:hypothetical protein BIW11_03394 [Tropilaelaps mercedesae]|uniref:Uncharacterized protein n=1 Tax=Tropilaelaps mercedesae TaxID=418985 RepID=A0A1V9XMJ3_9ACAR|nr:hypothetical protein BIW11_03394 [Tropilaelaps mercedesae]
MAGRASVWWRKPFHARIIKGRWRSVCSMDLRAEVFQGNGCVALRAPYNPHSSGSELDVGKLPLVSLEAICAPF